MLHQTFFQIIGVVFLILWFITLLFSITTITILIYYWRTHCRSTVNLLTCNSCVALIFYIMTVFIQMPSSMQRVYYDAPEPNPLICKMFACLATFGIGVMSCSFMIQAISRFFITILYKHKFLLLFRTNWLMIIISWISSAIIAGGMFISPVAYQYEPESQYCTLTTNHFLTSLLGSVILAMSTMATMIILYGIILYHIVRHKRLNPNSANTLRAKRNEKVFKKIFIFVGIFGIGGIPYCICTILNRVSRAPWPLYSLAFLFISLAAAINSIVLFVTNNQVKERLLTKLTNRQTNLLNQTNTIRRNQIVPCGNQMRTLQTIPTIY